MTIYDQPAYQIWSFYLQPLETYKRVLQNVENWMAWGSYGSLKVTKNRTIR